MEILWILFCFGALMAKPSASLEVRFLSKPGNISVLQGTQATLEWTFGLKENEGDSAVEEDIFDLVEILWINNPGELEINPAYWTDSRWLISPTPGSRYAIHLTTPGKIKITISSMAARDQIEYQVAIYDPKNNRFPLIKDSSFPNVLSGSDIAFGVSVDETKVELSWDQGLVKKSDSASFPFPKTSVSANIPARVNLEFGISRKLWAYHPIRVVTPDGRAVEMCNVTAKEFECKGNIYLAYDSERTENFIRAEIDVNIQNVPMIYINVPVEFSPQYGCRLRTKEPEHAVFVLSNTAAILNCPGCPAINDPIKKLTVRWRYLGTSEQPTCQDVMVYTADKLYVSPGSKFDRVQYRNDGVAMTIDGVRSQDDGFYEVTVINPSEPDREIFKVFSLKAVEASKIKFTISVAQGYQRDLLLEAVTGNDDRKLLNSSILSKVKAGSDLDVSVTVTASPSLTNIMITTHGLLGSEGKVCRPTTDRPKSSNCQHKISIPRNHENATATLQFTLDFHVENLDVFDIFVDFQIEAIKETKRPTDKETDKTSHTPRRNAASDLTHHTRFCIFSCLIVLILMVVGCLLSLSREEGDDS